MRSLGHANVAPLSVHPRIRNAPSRRPLARQTARRVDDRQPGAARTRCASQRGSRGRTEGARDPDRRRRAGAPSACPRPGSDGPRRGTYPRPECAWSSAPPRSRRRPHQAPRPHATGNSRRNQAGGEKSRPSRATHPRCPYRPRRCEPNRSVAIRDRLPRRGISVERTPDVFCHPLPHAGAPFLWLSPQGMGPSRAWRRSPARGTIRFESR